MFDLLTMQCGNCHAAGRCDGYKEGAFCSKEAGWRELAKPLERLDAEGLVEFLVGKMQIDSVRLSRAQAFEVEDGGLLDKSLQQVSAQLLKDTDLLARMVGGRPLPAEDEEETMLTGLDVDLEAWG